MVGALERWPEDKLLALQQTLLKSRPLWVPNPGAQTMARENLADELFMGGEPGGGKSSLAIGLAVTEHQRSIIFRREFPQVKGLEDEAARILGTRTGYNASTHVWRIPDSKRLLEFGSVPHEKDKEKYQGRPRDYFAFDEITHFSRSQYRYLTLWLRSPDPKQRTRILATGNPPQTSEGLWVIEHWAPWLDETYHDPAMPGELRWAAPADDDSDRELFFRSLAEALAHIATLKNPPRDHEGNIYPPRSRTFIPSVMSENPDYVRTGYGGVLAYASKQDRDLAKGKFKSTLQDDARQVIPTEWIMAAQQRWKDRGGKPPPGIPMVAVAVDVAKGGADQTVLAPRHDWWFAPLIAVPGVETKLDSDVVALLVRHRRDGAAIIVDVGGGYGGGVVERLKTDNKTDSLPFNGASAGVGRSKCRMYAFYNKRAEAWWRFREALDPDQPGGSPIELPDDPALRADLAAPRFDPTPRGILVEDKDAIKKRILRSPDRGDAVVMAWSEGNAAIRRGLGGSGGGAWKRPENKLGHATKKTRR